MSESLPPSSAQEQRKDYIVVIPTDPMGATDPMLIEGFPEHLRLIGSIVVAWSDVEYKLVSLFALMLRMPMDTARAIFYAIESSGARLDVLRATLPTAIDDDSARAEIIEVLDEAKRLLTQRNKYAHSIYGHTPDGEMSILGMRRASATDLPLHDLTHQFGRMKTLAYQVGRLLSIRLGTFSEQPSAEHEQAVLQKLQSKAPDVRIHPEPPAPPPPFEGSPQQKDS